MCYCDWRSPSASIIHGEFYLYVGPSAATHNYNRMYTYVVYGAVSKVLSDTKIGVLFRADVVTTKNDVLQQYTSVTLALTVTLKV